ncbi:hypothetical protein [Pseudorhodobacter sp.]|uniref:head-tail joining protein n=1 Tax=Pseudorhodobacter sp. TaxID=1934400 RepID=UPI002648CC75|nr:hypothetical protein [Pseudorhodobacter sp.]MDN5786914.1 hypothetical protein [Pseudorhodobacter sp.]
MIDFAADLASILDGPLAVDALWLAGGSSPATPIRAIVHQPDEVQDYGMSRVVSETTYILVSVADVPTPAIDDIIVLGGVNLAIHSEPRRDAKRIRWLLHLVPTP